ncbi:MIT-family metal ion transporter [Sphingobium herbicidovorans NBRC 16415]|uniref:MIT-family metal ion transporter n=1 Tax=Sphingobium herbicidovorans (strain ATCC 700291 / DSM 11019 / CCUG 56400 / KCTC 2939 / LMG 18315 / NBRC 16415 / MH) TaxID=1219045 RepID=A0A086PB62_SPHHM|nr:zinc transporter ZntB [Sphingobium herbicidovorans]KFG90630.1 MIT-family metal ion transporter [Sphingobium herbicidovorans NBRC 16415]
MSRVIVSDHGQAREISLDAFCAETDHAAFSWIHADGWREDAQAVVSRCDRMPEAALSALLAQETRPRCTLMAHGALINLRGLGAQDDAVGDPLVSIRLWAEHARVISVSYRPLAAIEPVMQRMLAGTIQDPGDLIAAFAQEITEALDPEVAELGDTLDEIESSLSDSGAAEVRREASKIRATAISYRRFISPQRQALERLSAAEAPWLQPDDRLHLQEAADRCARMAEELEAVRERSALAHEELTDLRAEQMNRQALIISVVALVFLPLTFLTGLLGMNVDGIPFAHEAWAFWGVVGVCGVMAAGIAGWFAATHWLR